MILAIELSSPRGGIALLRGDTILAQRNWRDDSGRHLSFWPHLVSLVEETKLDWAAITMLAAGRGPGSYSGIRAALTTASILAAPGGQPVYAVNTGAIMAADWFASGGRTRDRVTVAGDARRGAIWHATFVRDAVSPRQETNWTVSPIENFLLNIPADTPVLTIDKKRLAAILGERLPCDLIEATPSAVMLARLARNLASAGISTERLEPIYAHPPV